MVQDLESAFAELNIIEVVKERDEFKDIALRVQADFENYRKRAATQLADEVDRSTGRIVESLLPCRQKSMLIHRSQPISSMRNRNTN